MMWQEMMGASSWTGKQFSLMRIMFGTYVTLHLLSLMGWGAELFSNQGVIPEATHSPLMSAFPNMFAVCDSPAMVAGVLATGVVAGVLFTLGWQRRVMACVLWYIWAILLGRNPLILNPGMPYVGWMLLCFAAIDSGPQWSLDGWREKERARQWRLPAVYVGVAWAVMVAGYSYSGWMKLGSASWWDGSAIAHVLQSPLARSGASRELLLDSPLLLKALTWGTLVLELFAAPLAMIRRVRPYLWGALVGLHVGILCTVDFADLTLGMLMIHMLTWNPDWGVRVRDMFRKIKGVIE